MTIKNFLSVAWFYSYETNFYIHKDGKLLTKKGLNTKEIHNYSNEILSAEIKHIDFTTSGDNSGESYLTIEFYL